MKVIEILILIGALGTVPKGLVRRLEELEIEGRVESIETTVLIKIGQNTEKSSRDLMRSAVTQTPVKDYGLTPVRKTHTNNDNNNKETQTDRLISAGLPDLVTVNKKENLPNSRLYRLGGSQSKIKRKRKER